MASGKPELDWASYANTAQECSTVDFKNLSESNISLDKCAIIKNQSSSHQSSTSHQSEDRFRKLKPVQNQSNEDGMNTLQPKKITFNPLIECANKDAL